MTHLEIEQKIQQLDTYPTRGNLDTITRIQHTIALYVIASKLDEIVQKMSGK